MPHTQRLISNRGAARIVWLATYLSMAVVGLVALCGA